MRRYLFMALLAGSLPACAAEDSGRPADFEGLIKQGRAAYDAADLATASQFYHKACNADAMKSYRPGQVAYCHHQLATVSGARGLESEAEREYLLAVAVWKTAGPEYYPSWCVTLMNLGDLYRRQHRMAEAEQVLLQALTIAKDSESGRPELRPETLSRLGVTYQEMSRFDAALKAAKEALGRLGELATPVRAEEAFAWNVMGMTQLGSGHAPEAEASLRRATSLGREALGENHPETASYETNLALALIVQGEFDRAMVLLRRAKQVTEARAGMADVRLALILAEMSACAAGENKLGLAEEYGRQGIAVLNRQAEPSPIAIAMAQINLSDVYLKNRRADEAEAVLPGAIEIERQAAPGTRLLADGLRRLADLRSLQHSWQTAQDLYREAIGLYESSLGANSPALAPALRGYAEARRHYGGSKAEVRELESRARSVAGFLPHS